MKVGRQYIGKYVEIIWRDPIGGRHEVEASELPRGRTALAVWRERGVIDDVTEGVVRLIQSDNEGSPIGVKKEVEAGWVPEELIDRIEIYERVGDVHVA